MAELQYLRLVLQDPRHPGDLPAMVVASTHTRFYRIDGEQYRWGD